MNFMNEPHFKEDFEQESPFISVFIKPPQILDSCKYLTVQLAANFACPSVNGKEALS